MLRSLKSKPRPPKKKSLTKRREKKVPFFCMLGGLFLFIVIMSITVGEVVLKEKRSDMVFIPTNQQRDQIRKNGLNGQKSENDSLRRPVKEASFGQNDIAGNKDDNNDGDPSYHLIFSTDCSEYQHWQSYAVFYHAMKVGQPGHVTRIASGCTEQDAEKTQQWFDEHVRDTMSNKRFHLHLTPNFSSFEKEDGKTGVYHFFNKPFGLRHWMEHAEGMGIDASTGLPKEPDTVIILIDPDQVLLRPITAFYDNEREVIVTGVHRDNRKYRVEHGSPVAQLYGIGAKWTEFDLLKITKDRNSPALKVSVNDARKFYAAGPPYVATSSDMYRIAEKWADFVPFVHDQYPYLLAEMYGYSIAAAHVELPHQLINSLMVSNTAVGEEAWPFVDNLSAEEVCRSARNPNHAAKAVPSVLHYCQRFILGDRWFFGKRRFPKNFFSCDHPLLEEPPDDVAVGTTFKVGPGTTKQVPLSSKAAIREAYMICSLTSAMNEAGQFFRKKHCGDQTYQKSFNLHSLK